VTVITFDPDTREAMALARHEQMPDISMSRLDQYVDILPSHGQGSCLMFSSVIGVCC